MSRKEMEHLSTEVLEVMQLGIGVTSHESFLAQMILFNREESENRFDDYYIDPESQYNGFYDGEELDRRYDECRIDD